MEYSLDEKFASIRVMQHKILCDVKHGQLLITSLGIKHQKRPSKILESVVRLVKYGLAELIDDNVVKITADGMKYFNWKPKTPKKIFDNAKKHKEKVKRSSTNSKDTAHYTNYFGAHY